jgi:hypothetical protein
VWIGVKSPQESLLPAQTMVKSFTKGVLDWERSVKCSCKR